MKPLIFAASLLCGAQSVAAQTTDNAPAAQTGAGPAHAADAIWGADAMRPSRDELRDMHGNMAMSWFQADRLEYQAHQGKDGYLWDVEGYMGGDLDKLWLKSEGEGNFARPAEQAEVQALYSRAITPFFDLQAGLRQDLAGPARTYAVIGMEGLAPGLVQIEAAAFVSNKGDLTARGKVEIDQRITQRLIIQPRAELDFAAQNIPKLGLASGFDKAELGVRLRYVIVPELAPYIGIEEEWRVGRSADYAHASGKNAASTNFVLGIRFWL